MRRSDPGDFGVRAVTEEAELDRRLADLRAVHRALDIEIESLLANGVTDQLRLARLKKRKLQLRDEIARLGDLRIPDIIA